MSQRSQGEHKLEIVVLYCRYCIGDDEVMKIKQKEYDSFTARFLAMPCTSKIEISHLLKIIAEGADGLQVVSCKENQCHHLVGNIRAEKRIEYARRLLDEIRMGADRLGIDRGEGLSFSYLVNLARQRAETVRPYGPNLMKRGAAR